MKRGKKLLTYLFTVAFCFLAMAFFDNAIIAAANHQIVCVDRNKDNLLHSNDVDYVEYEDLTDIQCDSNTTDAYFVIKRYEVDFGTESIELPDIDKYNGNTYYVEKIYSNALVVVENENYLEDEYLILTNFKLPSNLQYLHSHALDRIQVITTGLTLPDQLVYVGSKIFKQPSAQVKEIFLNHYTANIPTGNGYTRDENITFKDDAFAGAGVEKIICASPNIYDNLVKGVEPQLPNENVTVNLEFAFYSSSDGTLVDSRRYYVGDVFEDLPGYLPVKGLTQTGWYYKGAKLEGRVNFINEAIIKVVADYVINPLKFTINATATETKYNGGNIVSTLKPNEIQHDLTVESGLRYTVVWTKDNSSNPIESVNDEISLRYAGETGTYKCTIHYWYVYEGQTYSSDVVKEKKIVINRTLLYA